jgi:ornithine cyclodeaminase
MPAWRSGRRIGVKLVTVFPGNAARNERAVGAVYVLFDARDGKPLAMFDGEELTARRTAGRIGVRGAPPRRASTRVILTLVGSGRLARELVEAHMHVRPIERVSLWSRTAGHAEALATAMAADGLPVTAVRDLERAVRDADIVSCATLSTEPLVRGAWLRAGMHLDLVGAFTASMRETDDAAIARAELIVVDSRPGALAEGGDIVSALASGAIEASAIAPSSPISRARGTGAHARRRDHGVQVGRVRARRPRRSRGRVRRGTRTLTIVAAG